MIRLPLILIFFYCTNRVNSSPEWFCIVQIIFIWDLLNVAYNKGYVPNVKWLSQGLCWSKVSLIMFSYVVICFALFVLSRIHFVNEEFVRIDNILTTYSTVVFKAIFILVFYVFEYWSIIVQMANFAYKELLNATQNCTF